MTWYSCREVTWCWTDHRDSDALHYQPCSSSHVQSNLDAHEAVSNLNFLSDGETNWLKFAPYSKAGLMPRRFERSLISEDAIYQDPGRFSRDDSQIGIQQSHKEYRMQKLINMNAFSIGKILNSMNGCLSRRISLLDSTDSVDCLSLSPRRSRRVKLSLNRLNSLLLW